MKPARAHNFGTYFVTAATWERRTLFRSAAWAKLFLKTLYAYRASGKYLLHEFVVMPDHCHLIITPLEISLERAVQFIKGGFSFHAGRQLASACEIWQKGFTDHRIRDAADYDRCREYIILNSVRAKFCSEPGQYPFSSAHLGWVLDDVPQRLKAA